MKIRQSIKGFSVIELLIAVIILGVLVAIIVPRLATRAELARQKAALSDLQNIQESLERAAIDTGYYFRLYVLDDTTGGDMLGFGDPDYFTNIIDGVADEEFTTYYSNNTRIFISPMTGDFIVGYDTTYRNLVKNETSFGWNGPYINWNRDKVDADGYSVDERPNNADDIPDDPWGHNYLLFTPLGLVLEPDGIIEENQYLGSETDVFDRMTILSLGPNGLPGSGNPGSRFGTDDDFFRQF